MRIFVDADACPVKEEIYKVAIRTNCEVLLVANAYLRIPQHPLLTMKMVDDGFDAADDFIAETISDGDIVITADILLADRCLKGGATVIAPNGKPFTESSIGNAVATRAIMADLRAGGDQIGGSAPFSKNDRSRFLQELDKTIVKLKK